MNNKYKDEMALYNVMHYCVGDTSDHYKCEYWGGYGVLTDSVDTAINEMNRIKLHYGKAEGKALCHIIITLYRNTDSKNKKYLEAKLEKERRECNWFAAGVSNFIYRLGYQNCYFKHVDSDHAHVHYVINSVNWMNGMKISNIKSFVYEIMKHLNSTYYLTTWRQVCYRNGDDIDY